MSENMVRFLILNPSVSWPPATERRVPVSEVQACPQFRLDAGHWIPRHKVEDCGGIELCPECGTPIYPGKEGSCYTCSDIYVAPEGER